MPLSNRQIETLRYFAEKHDRAGQGYTVNPVVILDLIGMCMPDELTTTEAAAELDIQSNSVKRLCQRGIIQAQKRGRDWFVSRDEVERYKIERRKAGRPPAPAARSDHDDPPSNGDE
jgi:excisionase family DNA binding protein